MSEIAKPVIILMAEDDEDDRLLTREAFAASNTLNELSFVNDGVELIEYLEKAVDVPGEGQKPLPDLILLDLNMPRKDGREALEEIKQNPDWRRIPVVVMTTSRAEEDVMRSYQSGAAGYIPKPISFEGLVSAVAGLKNYWVQIVKLPPRS